MSEDTGARAVQEARLRSALHRAAEPVSPEELARLEQVIRRGPEPKRMGGARRWRLIAPLLSAGAIAAVALIGALLAPARTPQDRIATAPERVAIVPSSAIKPRFVIIGQEGFRPLEVRDVASGALTGRIWIPLLPRKGPLRHTREIFQIDAMASPDDRTFVVGLFRAKPCQSRFYQFALNAQGEPGPVTPFKPLPAIKGAGVGSMAFSANGRVLAFSTLSGSPACSYHVTGSHIGVVNLLTDKVRQWSGGAGSLSLTFNGSLLAYNSDSGIKAMPTTSPPGPAARYSRTLVRAGQFGKSHWISFAAITPDGKRVYFNVFPEGRNGPKPGQIRVANIDSDRSRIIARRTGYPGLIFADSRIRHLLLRMDSRLVDLDLRSWKATPEPRPLRGFVGEIYW